MVMEEIYLDCQMIKRRSFGKEWIARPTVQVLHPLKKPHKTSFSMHLKRWQYPS